MSSSVSCVIAVFNGSQYLGEAVSSAERQSHGPGEIIVVDDGSTDDTPDVIRALGARVRAVRQANAGPSAAREHGRRLARGAYVGFLDADDLWEPVKVERQVAYLAAQPRAVAVGCLVKNFWIPELAEEASRYADHQLSRPTPGMTAPALLIRREAFDSVGGFDPALGHTESQDWLLRARSLGLAFGMVPEVLLLRRLHHANRSRMQAGASRDEFLDLVKTHLERARRA